MTSNPTMRADAGPPAWPCGERGQGQHAMKGGPEVPRGKSIRTPRTNISINKRRPPLVAGFCRAPRGTDR